jgi:hypothetical protein
MISKEEIQFKYFGDDSDPKTYRGAVCGIYKGDVARREFFISKSDDNFSATGARLTKEAVEDIIKEINQKSI